MVTLEQKDAIVAALTAALAVDNVYTPEFRSSYGLYCCHECGSRTSQEHGGCVNDECWIESAKQLLRRLAENA